MAPRALTPRALRRLARQVLGWIDMRGLLAKQHAGVRSQPHNYVLNGIAYHPPSRRLYVTGKKWDHMYQVRIKPKPEAGPNDVWRDCGLGLSDASVPLPPTRSG